MACVGVPGAEAIVATAAYIIVKKSETKKLSAPKPAQGRTITESENKIAWSRKLSWLLTLLWGGVILLAFEHFWHGEIVPFPPFLTAMSDPVETTQMLHEMGTVGVSMAVIVTLVWGVACVLADALKKRAAKTAKEGA